MSHHAGLLALNFQKLQAVFRESVGAQIRCQAVERMQEQYEDARWMASILFPMSGCKLAGHEWFAKATP
ncbi:hypothetical protein AYL99_05281 [Fonsecaea erecta]|uniref:Uncharacterized protein n=1 Tax=Fonsecaea erecta TaxID=1367422 RepID=A0A178ZKF3_9EURO|nr:hypothetical protein AYL99_05281 [Fonsecaea erecta]OAP60279.1 hypothetical protein AYL99_05281 [Fonsecaea erecta]